MCPFWITISRCRACASQALTPLLVTTTQNWPSFTDAVPLAGALNEVFQGMYLPPSKLLFFSRSFPDSFGTLTPAEPLVGAAFQSETTAAAGAAGAAGAGAVVAEGCAAGAAVGVTGGGAAGAVGAHEAAAQMASGATQKAIARDVAARRQARLSIISDPWG